MITIWKYPIPRQREFTIDLPIGAEVRKLDMQRGLPQLWVELDTEQPFVERKFYIVETGQEIYEALWDRSLYIGTFLTDYETLVFHLFEEIKE